MAAANGGWTPIGPGGGTVVSLAVHPSAPDTLYALTISQLPYGMGEIYHSSDGGASWRPAFGGLPFLQYSCQALALDPAHPSTLFTSIGPYVFRSTDGAVSWAETAATGPPAHQRHCALAIAPGSSSTLFFAYGRQLHRSLDGGATWNAAFDAPTDIRALLVNPTAPDLVYVATEESGGVWTSTDLGQTFTPSAWLDAADLLAAPPSGPPGLLYAVRSGTLYASIDGGALWRRRGTIGADGVYYALAVDPLSPRTLYAGHARGASVSEDGGETWQEANRGLPSLLGFSSPYDPTEVRALAVAPGRRGTVYAGTLVAGVYRSEDGGASWGAGDQRGLFAGYQSHPWLHPAEPDTFYVKDSAGCLWRTEDGGASWQRRSAAASRGFLFYDLTIDPRATDTLFAAGPAGVHRSDDGGITWTSLGRGQSGAASVVLTGPGELLAFQYGTDIARSTDGGKTWVQIPGTNFTYLVADPARPSTVYGTRSIGPPPYYDLYRSQDGGVTWNLLLAGGAYISVAAQHPGTLYVTGAGSFPAPLFQSLDDGASWQTATALPQGASVYCAIDPRDPETLYCGGNGLWRSTDGGSSWTLLVANLLPLRGRWGFGLPFLHPTKPKLYVTALFEGGLFELQLE